MESLSAPIGRRSVPWNWLLLAVSLLYFWNLPTTAQYTFVTINAAEGEDVILHTRNMTPDVRGFMWYRGDELNHQYNIARLGIAPGHRVGRAYSGREQINFDGSLLIKDVTLKDTGIYTVVIYLLDSKTEIRFAQLNVYERVRVPVVVASKTTVTESTEPVVLVCYTNGDSIQWFFNGVRLRLTKRKKLSWNDKSLTIDPVWKEDAGNYHCEVSNPISSAQSHPLGLTVTCY